MQGTPAARVWAALRCGGWLPRKISLDAPSHIDLGTDLLPLVTQLWRARSAAAEFRDRQSRSWSLLEWLERSLAQGARLTWGIPRRELPTNESLFEGRFVWWPRGIPGGRWVAPVSSRLGRRLDQRQAWFAALRAACRQSDREGDVLLTARDTAVARFVERAAQLFGLRLLKLEASRDGEGTAQWLRRQRQNRGPESPCDSVFPAAISPPIDQIPASTSRQMELCKIPFRDRAVVALGDLLVVLHLRPRGHWDRLVRSRLRVSAGPVPHVRLALGPELVRPVAFREFLDLGATALDVAESALARLVHCAKWDRAQETIVAESVPLDELRPLASIAISGSERPFIAVPSAESWSYLTHWTRYRDGPWPDESEEAYLDRLILGETDVDHSAFAALRRIVAAKRIIATAETIRGRWPVVCFTSVPLVELPRRRVFRAHRGRWDWEGYGLCVRREWLEQRGARPVCYGDDADWERLEPKEQPFFQLRAVRRSSGRAPIDWTDECEWRHLGDVELSDLPLDDGLLFVPSPSEAERLAPLSRWPIVILNG